MPWLAANALRSNDPDLEAATAAASPNPNLETAHPAAAANMHRVTGTFADPSHESAFAAQLFRMAYPTHVLLMALVLAVYTWMGLIQPDMRAHWAALVLCVAIPGLVCRVLLHRTQDPVRSQWMGSWAWMVLTAICFAVHTLGFIMAPAAKCAAFLQAKYLVPFVLLLTVLISGTHGLSSACKFTLMTIFLTNFIVGLVACHDPELDPWFICTMGAIVLGSATTHTGELYLRRSYSEKVQAKVQDEKSQARNEQLQAEKERLLYDVQRRGRPLDDDDERSAIRRGLLAGPSHPCPPTIDTDPSEAGAPAPSDSPPTLPPGPPSSASSGSVASYGQKLVQKVQTRSLLPSLTPGSPPGTAGGSSTAPPLTWAEADRQWLVAQGATHVEGLVLVGSSQNSTGFEGVYASGGGFGAELPKGAKRLRQDGFRSPAEAALARARWTKSLEEGKSLEEAGASSEQQEQEVVPARWAVLGGIESPMRFANRPGGPAQSSRSDVVPLSWVEADRQWHAENPGWARSVVADSAAGAATLLTPTAPAAESICNEELMEKVLAEMGTDGDGTAAASTVHARACTTDHSPCPPRPPNLQSCPPCTMPRRSPWVTRRPWSSYSELSG